MIKPHHVIALALSVSATQHKPGLLGEKCNGLDEMTGTFYGDCSPEFQCVKPDGMVCPGSCIGTCQSIKTTTSPKHITGDECGPDSALGPCHDDSTRPKTTTSPPPTIIGDECGPDSAIGPCLSTPPETTTGAITKPFGCICGTKCRLASGGG